jgi:hypothetical protein
MLVLSTLPTTFGASDCGELCILHQMITCWLSGCQRLEGDLPEPRRRVGVERVGATPRPVPGWLGPASLQSSK